MFALPLSRETPPFQARVPPEPGAVVQAGWRGVRPGGLADPAGVRSVHALPRAFAHSVFLDDFLATGRGDHAPQLEFEQLPFNHPLFILFTSGTTGAPKCMVHSAGVGLRPGCPPARAGLHILVLHPGGARRWPVGCVGGVCVCLSVRGRTHARGWLGGVAVPGAAAEPSPETGGRSQAGEGVSEGPVRPQ